MNLLPLGEWKAMKVDPVVRLKDRLEFRFRASFALDSDYRRLTS